MEVFQTTVFSSSKTQRRLNVMLMKHKGDQEGLVYEQYLTEAIGDVKCQQREAHESVKNDQQQQRSAKEDAKQEQQQVTNKDAQDEHVREDKEGTSVKPEQQQKMVSEVIMHEPVSLLQENRGNDNLILFSRIQEETGEMIWKNEEFHQESQKLLVYLQQKMNKTFHASSLDQQLLSYGPADLHESDVPVLPQSYTSHYDQAKQNIAHYTVEKVQQVGLSQKSENCSKVSSREELGDYFVPQSEVCERYEFEASLSHREMLANVMRAEVHDTYVVTLVTQVSEDRISTLAKTVQHWKGKEV